MEYVLAALGFLIAIGAGIFAAMMASKASKLSQRIKSVQDELGTAQGQVMTLQSQLMNVRGQYEPRIHEAEARAQRLEAQSREVAIQLDEARAQDTQKAGWLDHQQTEIEWLRGELEKRPKISRKVYKIITLGVKWTGKTSLTLKWANPLTDLGKIEGTKIERYERTVSQVVGKDVTTEHVFEVGDWGGEHIVDAQQELIVDEIHGMLIVVDLGGKDAKAVEPARVQEQLREFQTESLKFFFGPKTVASCKAVVLFINKSDLLAGTPTEIENQAKHYYGRLISDLMKFSHQVDIRVFVGSANYGHSIHHLFSHFVEKILPRNAYDHQLLQKMKADNQQRPRPAALGPALPAPSPKV